MGAALALVTERGTANVAVSDIAEAADVSRQLVYQQFGDRDTLLLETALDLARRELLPRVTDGADTPQGRGRGRVLAAARHFAEHRSFYRAMMTGPRGFELNKALSGLLAPVNQPLIRLMSQVPLEPELEKDLATFVTGGWAALVNTWVIEDPDPLDPEAFADRLLRIVSAIVGGTGEIIATAKERRGYEPEQPSHAAHAATGPSGDQEPADRARSSGPDA